MCKDHLMFLPLNCRWAVTFEAPKVTKSASHQKGFFAAQALTLQAGKTRAVPYVRDYALPREAIIVLPAFGRSCSAEGKQAALCIPELQGANHLFKFTTRKL